MYLEIANSSGARDAVHVIGRSLCKTLVQRRSAPAYPLSLTPNADWSKLGPQAVTISMEAVLEILMSALAASTPLRHSLLISRGVKGAKYLLH